MLALLSPFVFGRRKAGGPENAAVRIAKIEARTARSMARTNKWPAVTVPASLVLVAFAVAGKDTSVDLAFVSNVTLVFTAALTIPGGAIRIYFDHREKKRMRSRLDDLEGENRDLDVKRAELEGRLDELRSELERVRRRKD